MLAGINDATDTVIFDDDITKQLWPDTEQLAEPTWIDNYDGNTIFIKLPLISLFFIVNVTV